MKYEIYKVINGETYFFGKYSNIINAINAANELGLDGFKITVIEVAE